MLAPGSGHRRAEHAVGGDVTLGRSPACGPAGLFMPCLLGQPGSSAARRWRNRAGRSGRRRGRGSRGLRAAARRASMRKVTPPAVCQARTLPIDWPPALTSAIGAPPVGSIGAQARGEEREEKDEFAHGFISLDALEPVQCVDERVQASTFTEHLPLADLRARLGGQLRDRPVERRGQRMLHLHRFERQQALPLGNLFALRNLDRGHLAPASAPRSRRRGRRAPCRCRAPSSANS